MRALRRIWFWPGVGLIVGLWGGAVWASSASPSAGEAEHAALLTPLAATISGNQFALGPAGSMQTLTHVITNTGALTETFDLTATTRHTWTVGLTPTQIEIAPGAHAPITIQITIPAEAPPGMLNVITLTATNLPPATPITLRARDTVLAQGTAPLAIPPLQTGELISGQRVYSLTALISATTFLPNLSTPTYGYNGSFLGPTLLMTTGEVISLHVTNQLTEATITHWHGVNLPPPMDGGPHQNILPGAVWWSTFTLLNPASTVWYHPHPHGHTARQVYLGLAGFIFVREANALNLPQTYGVDEFPIVVQDRSFNADGSFREAVWPSTRKGDYFLVNGTLAGNLSVPAQMVRWHLLNGSNARFYNFGFSDNRAFYQIASDGAWLNQPVTRTRALLAPGERVEIVVDFSGQQGQSLHFINYSAELSTAYVPASAADEYDRANGILFSVQVAAPTPNPVTTLPAVLNTIARLSPAQAAVTRTLALNSNSTINSASFDMNVINITATLGALEVWSIFNASQESHPIHAHDTAFQIISRNNAPPPDYELGWKDTVIVKPLERVNIIKAFSPYADPLTPFVYHCHLLEHEDAGMMGQYVIVDWPRRYLPFIQR
jgi:bilirubin oxidase